MCINARLEIIWYVKTLVWIWKEIGIQTEPEDNNQLTINLEIQFASVTKETRMVSILTNKKLFTESLRFTVKFRRFDYFAGVFA